MEGQKAYQIAADGTRVRNVVIHFFSALIPSVAARMKMLRKLGS